MIYLYVHNSLGINPIVFLLCKPQRKRNIVTIDGYNDIPENNEDQLLKAVANQPVSVGICGSERAFQLYSKVSNLV